MAEHKRNPRAYAGSLRRERGQMSRCAVRPPGHLLPPGLAVPGAVREPGHPSCVPPRLAGNGRGRPPAAHDNAAYVRGWFPVNKTAFAAGASHPAAVAPPSRGILHPWVCRIPRAVRGPATPMGSAATAPAAGRGPWPFGCCSAAMRLTSYGRPCGAAGVAVRPARSLPPVSLARACVTAGEAR
jgi:hypothetical protein